MTRSLMTRLLRMFAITCAVLIFGVGVVTNVALASSASDAHSDSSGVSASADEMSAMSAMLRPGGGSSFKGGSSSTSGGSRSTSSSTSSSGTIHVTTSSSGYSSGSGGGGGGFGGLLILIIIVVIVIYVVASRNRAARGWSNMQMPPPYVPMMMPQEPMMPPRQQQSSPRRELLALQMPDPNFSLVLFDDFLVALYTEIKQAQGKGTLARYQPYLGPAAMQALSQHPGGEITTVIVGAASVEEVNLPPLLKGSVNVRIAFETNFTVRTPQGDRGVYMNEEWSFSRRCDAQSKPPNKERLIGCPNCGAPLDVVVGGVCSHCRSDVTNNSFDWKVDSIQITSTEARGPMLTANVAEEGTDLPTIKDPGAQKHFAALEANDPGGTTWASFQARVGLTFTEFQTAWASRDLMKMRPLMSDALFGTQTFWIEEYKRQHLRNITQNARIASLELANVTSDRFFDAVTVRLYASSLDFTVNDANQLVSGNQSVPRSYTEYWTMIRGRNKKGAPKLDQTCPNCGAPLNVTMVGVCTYCQVKVTTGEFDWVLSRIEQDESYRG